MADESTPRNRKERRALAKANGQKPTPTSASEIPLSQPSRAPPNPKTKTLLDIAHEHQSLLQNGQPFASTPSSDTPLPSNITTATINPNGILSHSTAPPPPDPDELIGPFGTSLVHALTLSMLYFTLTLLVYHQYAESYTYGTIFSLTLTTFPVLFLLVYLLHPYAPLLPTQMLFAGMSVAAGCYLLKSSHEDAYLAVMKRAPSLGTLWVWCVVEMRLPWAVGSLALVGGYAWRWGYGIF
ncbi:hypothetical protein MMC20_003261 [Loxospora ochrophaea]|nr:hypothetical protein [Loxospora ochrophaea]